jgi:hypothetical protein
MKKLSTLAAAIALATSAQVSAAPMYIDFTDSSSLNITSSSLVTSDSPITGYDYETNYWDDLTLDLGAGLELNVSATAYDNAGNKLANDGNRAVYYDKESSWAGLGTTSVTHHTGPLGTEYVTDDAKDGSIDIDSYLSLDSGNDALVFDFNKEIDFTSISFLFFEGDDRAVLATVTGEDEGESVSFKCTWGCGTVDSPDMTGSSFELMATDKIGGLYGLRYNVSEFRLGGIGIDYVPTVDPIDPIEPEPVPEPGTIALLGLGLLGLGISRKKQRA